MEHKVLLEWEVRGNSRAGAGYDPGFLSAGFACLVMPPKSRSQPQRGEWEAREQAGKPRVWEARREREKFYSGGFFVVRVGNFMVLRFFLLCERKKNPQKKKENSYKRDNLAPPIYFFK